MTNVVADVSSIPLSSPSSPPTSPSLPAIEIVSAKIERNRIKAILKARQLTQEEVARRVGVSYRQMNRVCLGTSDPSLLLATKISVILGEPLDAIFRLRLVTRQRFEKKTRKRKRATQKGKSRQHG